MTCLLFLQPWLIFFAFAPCGGQYSVSLGIAQGLFFKEVLQKGLLGPVKGLQAMDVPSSSAPAGPAAPGGKARRNRVPKPSWADMVEGNKDKELLKKSKEPQAAKDEPMEEEEEWWRKDWQGSRKSWNDWWQEKDDEWTEWKKWEEEEKEEAAAAEQQQKEAMKEEEGEKNVLVGQEAKWKNRTGSSKEKGRRKWAEHKAKEEGEDVEVCKLGALGSSRMKRLITRQQDRLTVKETAEAAERAAKQANEAAQAAQNTAQLAAWSWQPWQSQQYQQQQGYYWPLYSWNQGQVFFGLNYLFFDWHMFPHLPNNKFKIWFV